MVLSTACIVQSVCGCLSRAADNLPMVQHTIVHSVNHHIVQEGHYNIVQNLQCDNAHKPNIQKRSPYYTNWRRRFGNYFLSRKNLKRKLSMFLSHLKPQHGRGFRLCFPVNY